MKQDNQTQWVLDASHSELNFKVKHLMISNVKGAFNRFKADIAGEDLFSSPIRVEVEADSIFTNDEGRDKHLKSADFFDVENYQTLHFESETFTLLKGETYELTGMLTMKGVTHPLTLHVEFGGLGKDPWGNLKAAFSVSGTLSRKQWGLHWNAALETGGVLVSDEVRIQAEVQFVKKQAE